MCSRYSSRKAFIVLRTGFGALCPRPHRAVFCTTSAISYSSSRSSATAVPPVMRSKISSIRFVPSRQGTHLPQLSRWVKLMKNRATSTMQVSSSMTTMPPEPIIAPIFLSESKSSLLSSWLSTRQPPEGPPI